MAVVALVPVNVSVVSVGVAMDIEASEALISDGSSVFVEPSDSLSWLVSVLSHDSSIVPVSPVVSSSLDGHDHSSVG